MSQVFYSVLILVCLFLISIFFVFLKHHISLHHRAVNQKPTKLATFLSNVAYFQIIISISFIMKELLFYAINIITVESCTINLVIGVTLFTAHKIAVYLFVAIRSQVITKLFNIWFKLGVILICSYSIIIIMFVILIASGARPVFIFNGVCTSLALGDLFKVQLTADSIIGIYCLAVLILPLRKLLKEHNKDNKTIKNVLLYSVIAIISSISVYPVILFTNWVVGFYLVKLDLFLNVFCIIMQFTNVDHLKTIKPKCCQRIVAFFQYLYCCCSCCSCPTCPNNNICNNTSNEIENKMPEMRSLTETTGNTTTGGTDYTSTETQPKTEITEYNASSQNNSVLSV